MIDQAYFYNQGKKVLGGYATVTNVELDHIPATRFYNARFGRNQKVSDDAPTLAISGFDHGSKLWRSCTTSTPKFAGIFDAFANTSLIPNDKNSFMCTIFAILRCLCDKEMDESISNQRIYCEKNQTAFKRYHFKNLQLHLQAETINKDQYDVLTQWVLKPLHDNFETDKKLMDFCCEKVKCATYGFEKSKSKSNPCLEYESKAIRNIVIGMDLRFQPFKNILFLNFIVKIFIHV